jgi:cyclic di-GMP phosphodiesterase
VSWRGGLSRQPDDSRRSVVVMGELHPRVLIVDDEPANVLLLKEFLTDTAGDFRLLTDSREVEQVFNEFKPDIVLLDLHMPNLDGHEILTRLQRARDAMGFVPFVILTSDTSTAARNTALVRGANDFLTKPLDRIEVVLRVRNLLRTRELYVELAETARMLEGKKGTPHQP